MRRRHPPPSVGRVVAEAREEELVVARREEGERGGGERGDAAGAARSTHRAHRARRRWGRRSRPHGAPRCHRPRPPRRALPARDLCELAEEGVDEVAMEDGGGPRLRPNDGTLVHGLRVAHTLVAKGGEG
jgi:hypothetical protein